MSATVACGSCKAAIAKDCKFCPGCGTENAGEEDKRRKMTQLDAPGQAIVAALNASLGSQIQSVDTKVDQLGKDVGTLGRRMDGVEEDIGVVKQSLKKQSEQIEKHDKRFDTLSTEMRNAVKEEVAKAMGALPGPLDHEHTQRDKQVIASGFEVDTDADIIIAKINSVLDEGTRRHKVVDVTTFSDPASVGVITFETAAAKIGFYRKLKGHDIKLDHDRHLRFKDNEPWEVRMRNKYVGQAKYQINKQLGIELKEIKIDRKTYVVEVYKKKVAWFKEGEALKLEYDNSVKVIAAEVEKAMHAKMAAKQE